MKLNRVNNDNNSEITKAANAGAEDDKTYKENKYKFNTMEENLTIIYSDYDLAEGGGR